MSGPINGGKLLESGGIISLEVTWIAPGISVCTVVLATGNVSKR
jgi:hypothetical protein